MRILLLFWLIMHGALGALDLADPEAAETELGGLVAEWEAEIRIRPSEEAKQQLGLSLQALGVVQRQLGKATEALRHLSRACDLLLDHPSLPDAMEARALTLQDLGRLAESESELRRVLEIRKQQPGPGVLAAISLDHLALNLLQQGRYAEVEPLLKEALSLIPNSSQLLKARLLGHMGRLRHTLGSHAKAIEHFDTALAMSEGDDELTLSLRSQRALALLRLGRIEDGTRETEAVAALARSTFPEAPLKALPYLNNLGALALQQDQIEEARSVFEEALSLARSKLGDRHPGLTTPLNNLGVTLQILGDYDEAEKLFESARDLQIESGKDESHLRVAEILRNLGRNALLAGNIDAQERVDQATSSGLRVLEKLIKQGSERERLNFLERFDLVSLSCISGDAQALANLLLASKSRLLDAMLRDGGSAEIPTWQEVQASLPANGAFVDTCRYQPLDDDRGISYGAVLILPSGPPQWIPLGSERDLLDWLRLLRERLVWQSDQLAGQTVSAPSGTMSSALKGLELQFWKPFAKRLPDSTHSLAFSPDGALHFVPLAALLNRDGIPLAHRFRQVTTVASGRALLDVRPLAPIDSSPWTVLTISDFPLSKPNESAGELALLLSELEPMPGTAREARILRQLAPKDSRFLADSKVTETMLRNLTPAPGVLHFGCHAFYTGPERISSELALDFDENPQLLKSSGLVLYHGADLSVQAPPAEDDLLFPSEIAQLPLAGTRLVTLSSCESGAGTPVGGEGILGLHRAFAQAGAREIAVALWPVSDQTTPEFMARFYQLAMLSNRTAQALWQTQSEFLPRASDPDFELKVLRFAPFNLSQNAPLQVGPAIEAAPPQTRRILPLLLIGLGLLVLVRAVLKRWKHPRRRVH